VQERLEENDMTALIVFVVLSVLSAVPAPRWIDRSETMKAVVQDLSMVGAVVWLMSLLKVLVWAWRLMS